MILWPRDDANNRFSREIRSGRIGQVRSDGPATPYRAGYHEPDFGSFYRTSDHKSRTLQRMHGLMFPGVIGFPGVGTNKK
jgi:hypothetical protein